MWHIRPLNHKSHPTFPSHTSCSYPNVSVIIPARNESHNIVRLLQSLKCQTFPPLEVVVVDDDSTDDTANIAKQLKSKVISIKGPPVGWCGKSWACWQGVQNSSGDLLLFLDADTWMETHGIEMIVSAHSEYGGMISTHPFHVTQKFYEQFSAFFNIVSMAGINAFTPLGTRLQPRGAFGQCMACSREDYLKVGGHSAVKGEIIEDVELAIVFSKHSLPVTCFGGQDTISSRMYPDGFRQLVEGWSKNLGSGAFHIRTSFLLMIFMWITGAFQSFLTLALSLTPPTQITPLYTIPYVLYTIEIGWILKRIGNFHTWVIVLFPIPLIFFAIITTRSLILTYFLKRVKWKGRTIATT
ncbi:MAG: glycosyltransferase [Chloroflexota bacterium]|nr:glycosyltransferase [Chloroflexota bacterium]